MVGDKKFTIFTFLKYAFIALYALIIIYPLLNVLAVSLSEKNAVLTGSVTFYPIGFELSSYKLIWSESALGPAYLNTIKYVTLYTLFSMFVTTCGAYALSKGKRLWGYNFFMGMVLVTMFFGGGMIPTYLTVKMYGLINTTTIIVVMGCCSAYNLIVMKSFFQNLPKDLEDAGKIDGLNDFGVLWKIVLPLSTAILTTIALFYAVGQWNAYMTPFIYLNEPAKYPVQIILREMLLAGTTISNDTNVANIDSMIVGQSLINATIVVSILPMIVIYPFLQKYFVKGVMIGSLKG